MTGHVHAALMIQYAQDATETPCPWVRWQYLDNCGVWRDCRGDVWFSSRKQYRRKPRTHIVNGFEVPAPMREAPEKGSTYWIVAPTGDTFCDVFVWGGDVLDHRWLERGLVHATKEAAIANAKAMCGVKP